jgi:hypothetical protein
MYSYISQISNFGDIHWEKNFVFLPMLNKKLPKEDSERISVLDSVDLDSFRIQKIGESKLVLEDEIGGDLPHQCNQVRKKVRKKRNYFLKSFKKSMKSLVWI